MSTPHFDVLIVGAGLSGIGAAHHLKTRCRGKSYALLEARDAIGGTWDLFRYPGIRSDSDMYTLGYSFRPWKEAKAIADGPSILNYVRQAAQDGGIDQHIRFHHRVVRASWRSEDSTWTVECEVGPSAETRHISCNFLYMCSGYYSYAGGYTPDFAGIDEFKGRIVHPQKWTDDIAYAGKRVVIIGSGATAVTLVPAMAETAAHVTMLQRSPSYIMSLPAADGIADFLRRVLPEKLAYSTVRWKNVGLSVLIYQLSRRRPDLVKRLIRGGVRKMLGRNSDVDIDKHFSPSYNPWDQRLCLVPDGDLFKALRKGRASVVTDHIERFTETGIRLKSGGELAADIVVTATGLKLIAFGGMKIVMDGITVDLPKTMSYKGLMLSGVPNFAFTLGYTNASWTLKADLTSEYVCRVLNFMDRHGHRQCTPENHDPSVTELPFIDFSSGYVQRALGEFPKQGSKTPWKLRQNYALDIHALRHARLDDGALQFAGGARASARQSAGRARAA